VGSWFLRKNLDNTVAPQAGTGFKKLIQVNVTVSRPWEHRGEQSIRGYSESKGPWAGPGSKK